jgi:hypothetical protein
MARKPVSIASPGDSGKVILTWMNSKQRGGMSVCAWTQPLDSACGDIAADEARLDFRLQAGRRAFRRSWLLSR